MKKPLDTRKIGITIAIILGLFVTLYLGGLFGQLWINYQNWLEEDGISGGATLESIDPNPLVCIPRAFSAEGIRGTGFILMAAGGIILYVKLHDRFSSKRQDERNFKHSDSGLYGTAAWMTPKEMKQVLGTAPHGKETGIILGEKNGKLIYLPDDTRLAKHIAVFGSTGSRKSRGFVRPYLYGSIMRGESVVLSDPKMELYSDTSEIFRKHGYTVRILNLAEPLHGDSWNCMADIGDDTMLAQILTDVIISNTSNGKSDRFWDSGEGDLFKALCLFVSCDSSRGPEAKNLPAVYQLLTQTPRQQLNVMFDKLPINHPAKPAYNLFAQASETVQTGIVMGLGTRLQILQNEAVQKITSYSDIDLELPGKQKCAYFIIIDDQHSTMEFLSSLFFNFLFIKLVNYANRRKDKRCKVPVNVIFEELNSIGRLPDMGRKISMTRSRLVQIVLTAQNLGQLQNRYPDGEWSEILSGCDTQIMMGCNDQITAEAWSLRSGDATVQVEGAMTVRQTLAVAQVIPQYRHTEGKGRRRLLTADEVLRLDADEVLVALRGQNLLKLTKTDFERHPMAREIEMVSVYDYLPARRPMPVYVPQTEPEKPKADKPEKPGRKNKPGPRLFDDDGPPIDF